MPVASSVPYSNIPPNSTDVMVQQPMGGSWFPQQQVSQPVELPGQQQLQVQVDDPQGFHSFYPQTGLVPRPSVDISRALPGAGGSAPQLVQEGSQPQHPPGQEVSQVWQADGQCTQVQDVQRLQGWGLGPAGAAPAFQRDALPPSQPLCGASCQDVPVRNS